MLKRLLPVIVLATAGFTFFGAERERTYSAEPITAWVVDKETRQGIPGVNVVAVWELDGGLEGHVVGVFKVLETVSDDDGKFHFPAWGPETRKVNGVIRGGAPRLLLFKHGYRPDGMPNMNSLLTEAPSTMRSEWNGRQWPLERYRGMFTDYASDVAGRIDAQMGFYENLQPCLWRDLPQLRLFMKSENRALRLNETDQTLVEADSADEAMRAQRCRRFERGEK